MSEPSSYTASDTAATTAAAAAAVAAAAAAAACCYCRRGCCCGCLLPLPPPLRELCVGVGLRTIYTASGLPLTSGYLLFDPAGICGEGRFGITYVRPTHAACYMTGNRNNCCNSRRGERRERTRRCPRFFLFVGIFKFSPPLLFLSMPPTTLGQIRQ